jgi:hypothetical protein
MLAGMTDQPPNRTLAGSGEIFLPGGPGKVLDQPDADDVVIVTRLDASTSRRGISCTPWPQSPAARPGSDPSATLGPTPRALIAA